MSLMDNFGKKIGEAVSAVGKMSGELVEVTKINMEIRSKEEQIQKLYVELGKIMYKKYEEKTQLEDQLSQLCIQITAIEKESEALKAKLLAAKNIKACPACKAEVSASLEFCSSCGVKIAQSAPQAAVEETVFCTGCGAKLPEATKFCGSCGKKAE